MLAGGVSEMTLGQKLKELRSLKGLTQKELADKLHVSFQTVSKWEKDENEPDIVTLKQLAKLFGCSVDSLLGGNEEEKGSEPNKRPYRETMHTNAAYVQTVVDRDHGYTDGVKKVSKDFYNFNSKRFEELFKELNVTKSINIQYDSLIKFFIDEKLKIFGFFFQYGAQFVCPFENFISFSLSDSGFETATVESTIFGVGVGRNPSIAVGSMPHSVGRLPLSYYLTINYRNEEGGIETYKLMFPCSRVYPTLDGTVESPEECYFFVNEMSRFTSTKLKEICSLLVSIKETAADFSKSKSLPEIPADKFTENLDKGHNYLKENAVALEKIVNEQKYYLGSGAKIAILVIVLIAIIIAVIGVSIGLYIKYK